VCAGQPTKQTSVQVCIRARYRKVATPLTCS
jgi:hypothetical protein